MEFHSSNHQHHQNRYVPRPPNYSDDRNFYNPHPHPHPHQQHPRLPPPSSFSVLPPAPPHLPPPPYNPHQPQFTFLSRQHENPRLPPPRVSHRNPFQYQDSWQNPPRVISPYHPTQSFNIGSNSRLTDPFMHNSYRDDNVIGNSNNNLGGGGVVDHHYMPNSNRSVKGFEFGTGSSYNNNNKNVDFERNLSDERWVHAPMKLENNEFEDGDGVQSRRGSKVFASPGKFSNRSRDSREEFVPSPKKQIQKKSVLLRIGRPNNRNRTHIHTFKAKDKDKDKDPVVYSEEETEGSPVELDVSFKSNSLVAKPIMTPSSSATGSDRKISSSNRKTRKPNLSFSPIIKFAERLGKSENSKHGLDCPSSSDKGTIPSPEKVTVCSGTSDSAGSSALKGSPEGKISKQVDNDGATDGSPPRRVKKRKKVEPPTLEVSSLQTTKKDGEPFNTDSSTNIPSAPDQGLMHTKEKITSAGTSPRTPNELTVKKVDESPMQAISLEKDDAKIDSTRSCVPETKTPDTKTISSTHLLGYSSTTEIEINGNTETEERSVHNLQFVSKFDEVLNELQAESIISNTDRVDDVCQQPYQTGSPLLLANDIVAGSSVRIVSAGDNGSVDFSRLEEIRSCEGLIDAHDPAHVPFNGLSYDFNRRQENIIVSGFNSADTGPKQSSLDDVSTAELETCILEESRDLFHSIGSNGALGLPNAEENKIHEGATNVDCSNRDSANTTSSSFSSPTNFQADNIVSNTYDLDDTSKQPFVDEAKILLESGLVEGSLKPPEILLGDKPNVSSGKDSSSPKEKRKRKVRDIQLGLSSPNTSNSLANAVSSVRDADATLSYTFKDLVSTEEEVRNLNISNEGSSEVEVLIRGGVNGGPNRISPKSKKKRKVFATDEKPKAEDILNDSVDNSKSNMTSEPAKVSDISINTHTASHSSHGTNKTIQSLNTKGELNLTRNQSRSAVSSVISGRSSLVLPRKTTPISQSAKRRTWHRTGDPSASPLPPRISPKKVGKFQSSYIRKGNSLVRKPTPVTNLPRASSSPSVYRLNSSGIDQTQKSSGSVSKVDVIDTVKTDGSNNASFERPKTPPLPLNCTIDHSGDFAYLPLANHPSPNDCSDTTTLDRLELTENVNDLKFSEVPLKYSGTPESQTAPVSSMESHRVLDDGSSGKKIIYVKRKSNQLVAAASNSSDQSTQDVDTTQALSSDGYYKRRKNQLIRTSVEGHKIIAVPNDTSEEQNEVISSKRFSKRQFGKGLDKLYKPSKFSSVWRLCNAQSSRKLDNSLQRQKVWPHLFPWKRATYWRSYMHNSSAPISNNSSLSQISRKLLLSRKRDTIYTRSTHGFSLRMSKLLSVGGSSLKWSKSIEQDSKRANEEATLAVAAVQKKKREQNGAAVTCVVAGGTKRRNHFPRERIFRIGAVRYRMDPTRRTLQRISEKEPSNSTSLQSDNGKKSYVPKRLVIGNDEYVRIGNGNQLVRDPKKRTRILASEKVRWSLHTARLRLARKMTYCQFFTRFGTCNKDAGKCPYIHDPSKIAVCTKFLSGSCSNPNCKLTHKVIPERMQDCSYFLQGLCSNENCPYRHVNVNPNASICEGFLKGYCADGDECPKKHTYVCPVFEATGTCPQGSKCKLHHPKNRTKGMKGKPLRVQKNARGRYFGSRNNIDIAELKTSSENRYSKDDDEDIFSQEGKFTDYIALDVSEEEVEETIETTANQRMLFANSNNSDLQVADIGDLTKPIKIMGKSNERIPPSVDRPSERTVS